MYSRHRKEIVSQLSLCLLAPSLGCWLLVGQSDTQIRIEAMNSICMPHQTLTQLNCYLGLWNGKGRAKPRLSL